MITNPQVIKFTNEVVRVRAEELRALRAKLVSDFATWSTLIVPNDVSAVEDNREAEGVSRLTGVDLNDFMYLLGLVRDQLNNAGAGVIDKPCVRPLSAE